MEQNTELIQKLITFGLSEKGAKLYLILLKYGPKPRGELTESMGSYRVEVYRLLEKLTKLGLIEESLTKPVIYAAVPIEQALNAALMQYNSERASMEAVLPAIVEEVNQLLRRQADPIPHEGRLSWYGGEGGSTMRCDKPSSPLSVRLPLSSPPMDSTNGLTMASSMTH